MVVALGLAVGFAVALAAGAARRGHDARRHGPSFEVTHLNRRYRDMVAAFERTALSRKAFRAPPQGRQGGTQDPRQGAATASRERRRRPAPRLRPRLQGRPAGERGGGVARRGDHDPRCRRRRRRSPRAARELGRRSERPRTRGVPARPHPRARDPAHGGGGPHRGERRLHDGLRRDRILAAPFAIVGSIGVFAMIPNLHRLLEGSGVDVEQFQAGEFKLTVNMLGKPTDEGRAKLQDQLDTIHKLFKDFGAEYRPALDVERCPPESSGTGARPRPRPGGRNPHERRLPVRGEPGGGPLPRPGRRTAVPPAPDHGAGGTGARPLSLYAGA